MRRIRKLFSLGEMNTPPPVDTRLRGYDVALLSVLTDSEQLLMTFNLRLMIDYMFAYVKSGFSLMLGRGIRCHRLAAASTYSSLILAATVPMKW